MKKSSFKIRCISTSQLKFLRSFRIRNAILLLVVYIVILTSSPVLAQSALSRIKQNGEIRIGTDATYPPFEIVEGREYIGFDIDLMKAIARELGVKPHFTNSAGLDGAFFALQNGTFDVVISAVTINQERKDSMLFSDPYYDSGQLIAVRKETVNISSPDDLKGKKVGVQIRTTAHDYLEKLGGVEIEKYNTIDLALQDLVNKRIDAVVGDAPTLKWMIFQSFKDLKTVGQRFTDEKFGIAVAHGNDDIVSAINSALKKIKETGEYDQIHQKWFGEAAERALQKEADQSQRKVFDFDLVKKTLPLFLYGVWMTLRLAFLSFILGLPIGLLLALMRVQPSKLLAFSATMYIEIMRGTPLLVQILFIYYVLPYFEIRLPPFTSGIIALTLNSAAYIAEIFRAGIESIDSGQMEAARSLGMTYWQSMRRIILPQTFRRVVPPLTNEAISLLKDSSLVSIIGLTEITRTGQELASRYAAPITIWLVVAIIYLLITFPLTRVSQYLEKKWKLVTRTGE